MDAVITTTISFVVSGLLGFITSFVTSFVTSQKKKAKKQDEALKCLLRSNITSKYYVYNKLGEIPEYEKENLNYLAQAYYSMGGNSYIKTIMNEINGMKVK